MSMIDNIIPVSIAQIFLSHRFDFESATVFEQPTAGSCAGDTITVGQTTTTLGSFANLCGTLTGQHSNKFNIIFLIFRNISPCPNFFHFSISISGIQNQDDFCLKVSKSIHTSIFFEMDQCRADKNENIFIKQSGSKIKVI